jgi:hypothetical protein
MNNYTVEQQEAILNSMIESDAVAKDFRTDKSTGETLPTGNLYITPTAKVLSINPKRKKAFDFLSQFAGQEFAGYSVSLSTHTTQAGEDVPKLALTVDAEWESLI